MVTWGIPDVVIDGSFRQNLPFLLPFGIIGIWRWTLFLLRVVFWLLYRPIKPKKNADGSSANRYQASDVTLVVPTIDCGEEFKLAARSWKVNEPYELIIVTSDEMHAEISMAVQDMGFERLRVLSVGAPNKRKQMVEGVNAATTDLIAFTDDDAIWTPRLLEWCLAPFDDEKMGGVGPQQEMIPVDKTVSFWEVIADFRLTMRMIETSASTFVDGGMSCISGRTAIYRRCIVNNDAFREEFTNETWLNKYHLHSGDDKFLTRWIVKNGWNMQMQNHKEASLKTTFKNDSKFINQVLRWTRNTWRSDIKSIFVDHKVLWRYPYVAFNMFDKFINPLPLLWGLAIIIGNTIINGTDALSVVVLPVTAWLLISRTMRLIPHIIRKPEHIVYIPAMLIFQYFFIFAKIYAVLTLHVTDWGSRASADTSDSSSESGDDTSEREPADVENLKDDVTIATAPENRMDRTLRSPGSDLSDGSTISDDEETPESKFIPWYRRPCVIIGAVIFAAMIWALSFMVRDAVNQREEYFQMALISKQKALAAERATGHGFYDKEVGRTFLAFAGEGLNPTVLEFDHVNQTFVNEVEVAEVDANMTNFVHYPRMVQAADGKIVVVYTDSPTSLHVSKCDTPHTSDCNWIDSNINFDNASYPCLTKASTGSLYLFYRSSKLHIATDYRPLHYVKSVDDGETWSDPRIAIDSGGFEFNQDPLNLNEVYFDCPRVEPSHDQVAERFAIGWTNAGGGPGVRLHNNYHKDVHFAYFYPGPDLWTSVDGQVLGEAIGYDDMKSTVVVDTGALDPDNRKSTGYYFASSYLDGSWYPIMMYNLNRTLYSATWNGMEWDHSLVMEDAAINLFDIDKRGPTSFRLYQPQRSVFILDTFDGGKNWEFTEQLIPDGGSASKVSKITDAHPDLSLVALENDWSLYHSDEPTYLNYVGSYNVWGIREMQMNPIEHYLKGTQETVSFVDPTTNETLLFETAF